MRLPRKAVKAVGRMFEDTEPSFFKTLEWDGAQGEDQLLNGLMGNWHKMQPNEIQQVSRYIDANVVDPSMKKIMLEWANMGNPNYTAAVGQAQPLSEEAVEKYLAAVDNYINQGTPGTPAPNEGVQGWANQQMVADNFTTPDRTFAAVPPEEARAAADQVNTMLRTGRGDLVTERMFAQAMQERPYFLEGYDLPMDEASRMARADEYWPQDGFHYTHARTDYDYPRTDVDGGFHYGTKEAAYDRGMIVNNIVPSYTTAGGNEFSPHIPDRSWNDVIIDARERIMRSGGEPAEYGIDDYGEIYPLSVNDNTYAMLDFDPRDAQASTAMTRFNGTAPRAPRTIPLRLNAENMYEMPHDLGQWTPDRMAIIAQGQGDDGIREAYEANLNILRQSPEAAKNLYGLPIDDSLGRSRAVNLDLRAAQDAIARQEGPDGLPIGNTGAVYPNEFEGRFRDPSGMIFDPRNIRAKLSALFDPRLRHLGNISAGVGTVSLGASLFPGDPQE